MTALTRRPRVLWAVLLAAVATALAVPASASAHAVLKDSNPGAGQRVEQSPKEITLFFSGPVKVLANSVQVISTTGQILSGAPHLGANNRTLVAPLQDLPKGGYTVRWRSLSALDGHLVSGVFTFGVRFAAPPATDAYGSKGPAADEQAIRWVYFLAIALLGGGLFFRLVVLRGLAVPARTRRFLAAQAVVGAVLAIEIGQVGFLLRASNVLQLGFVDFLYGDVSPIAEGTRFGLAFIAMTMGFVVVTALLVLSWLGNRREWPLYPALALTLGLSLALSLSGHDSEGADPWGSVLADFVHTAAAQVWIGGLIAMAACLWWTAPELRREAFLRFSRVATVAVVCVVGAGIYLTTRRLVHTSDLWETRYGNVLILKLVLVSAALAWGGFHHAFVRPVLLKGGREGFVGRLQRSLLGESAVVAAALLLAAVLVNSEAPVPQQKPAASPAALASDRP